MFLCDAGIPGLKYADQGSRSNYQVTWENGDTGFYKSLSAAQAAARNGNAKVEKIDGKDASYNYVIFDDSLVTVKEKYALMKREEAVKAARESTLRTGKLHTASRRVLQDGRESWVSGTFGRPIEMFGYKSAEEAVNDPT